MMKTNILELENKAKDLLKTIELIKYNRNNEDLKYNTTIDSFFQNISGLSDFLKSMRPNGYFGMSPQDQKDLDKQQEMIEKLREIKEFVESSYNKNKDIIGQ